MMIVEFDKWEEVSNFEGKIINPSYQDIKKIINLLDQKKHTALTISDGTSSLTIAGGKGVYLAYKTTVIDDEEYYHSLLSHEPEEGFVELFIGGQTGEYEKKYISDKKTVKKTAKKFLKGKKDKFNWEEN